MKIRDWVCLDLKAYLPGQGHTDIPSMPTNKCRVSLTPMPLECVNIPSVALPFCFFPAWLSPPTLTTRPIHPPSLIVTGQSMITHIAGGNPGANPGLSPATGAHHQIPPQASHTEEAHGQLERWWMSHIATDVEFFQPNPDTSYQNGPASLSNLSRERWKGCSLACDLEACWW